MHEAATARRFRLPGEVRMENNEARTYLRRAGFEQWVSVKVVLGAGT